MKKFLFSLGLALAVFGTTSLVTVHSEAASPGVIISTGGEKGLYHKTGQRLCELLIAKGVKCKAQPSQGSIANLMAIAGDSVTFAMAQSDWQFHAMHNSNKWNGPDLGHLRAVFSLYPEAMQIVVNRDAGIKNWSGLKGRSIDIGHLASGHRQTLEEMLKVQRRKLEFFGTVSGVPSIDQVDHFCAGKFDAFIYAIGIPSAAVKRAVSECNGMLIAPHRTIVRKLVTAARPYYAKVKIPAKTYWDGQPKVDTFGVVATLVTSQSTDPKIVKALVEAVFENLPSFKSSHPAYENLTPAQMISDGLSAPLHAGAKDYYVTKGWLK